MPPVPGFLVVPPVLVPVSVEALPVAMPPETTILAATPLFSALTCTLPPEVKDPRVPEVLSEARSPMTAWVSRMTRLKPTEAPTPTPWATDTPPSTLKSQVSSWAETRTEPLSAGSVPAGSRMSPEATSMTAPFSIWAMVLLRTMFTPTVPFRPKFSDLPPEAPTFTPSTSLSAVTWRVSACRFTPSSILAVTVPA